MHIAFTTPEYPTKSKPEGGLATYIKKASFQLAERGHDVSVFWASDKKRTYQEGEITIFQLNKSSLNRLIWPLTKVGLNKPLNLLRTSKKISKKVSEVHKQKPIDVIQSASYGATGYNLINNDQIPVVSRISSYPPLWVSAYGRKRSFSEYLCHWLEIKQVMDSDISFAPSKLLSKVYKRYESTQLEVVRTPFDFEEIEYDQSLLKTIPSGEPYLLYFGQLSKIKGVDLLIDALSTILEKHKNINVVFIGRDDGYEKNLMMTDYLSHRLNSYSERIYNFKQIPKSKLYPVIENAYGVILPSRVDNYPNACLETLQLRVPVIGTYNSSLDEMVKDRKTGFLAKNGDSGNLSLAISKLLNLDKDDYDKICNNIEGYMNKVNEQDRIGELEKIYRQAISKFSN